MSGSFDPMEVEKIAKAYDALVKDLHMKGGNPGNEVVAQAIINVAGASPRLGPDEIKNRALILLASGVVRRVA